MVFFTFSLVGQGAVQAVFDILYVFLYSSRKKVFLASVGADRAKKIAKKITVFLPFQKKAFCHKWAESFLENKTL